MNKILKVAGVAAAALWLVAAPAQAVMIDLSAGGQGSVNGGLFVWVDQQSTGTGVIEPFVRLQDNGTEEGFNTSGSSALPTLDEKAGIWTHDLTLGDVPLVEIDDVVYLEFLLDINQNRGGDNELLSLDKLELYYGGVASPTQKSQLGTLAWTLDPAGTDNWIKLNFMLNPGSGAGDMFAYIPKALFPSDPSLYINLYSYFGTNFGSNDGFEEWAIRASTPVPEPGTLLLLGSGLLGAALLRRRQKNG